jgi:nicotinamide-nucleotide amidase
VFAALVPPGGSLVLMKAEILTIGDELLRGEIVDSNKSLLSEQLLGLGIETRYHLGARRPGGHDRRVSPARRWRNDIVRFRRPRPTRDDPRRCWRDLRAAHRLDPGVLETIRAFFAASGADVGTTRGRRGSEGWRCCQSIGTAPGFLLEQGRALFFCMPAPRELSACARAVLPRIAAPRWRRLCAKRCCVGMAESSLTTS